MKQKIIITALPNGINTKSRNGGLKVSAAISLQVEDVNDTLQNVKDMLNWAELIKNAKFIVQYNGATVEAKVISPPPDTALWKNLFSPTVKVRSFVQEELYKMPIASYPVKHILSYIKSVVEYTGKTFINDMPDSTHYTENPLLTDISDYTIANFPNDNALSNQRRKLTLSDLVSDKQNGRRIQSVLNKSKFIPFSPQASATSDFAQLKNFHGLYNKKGVASYIPVEKPDFEFHDILSILSGYPQLQRKLGLVVDLEFNAPVEKIVTVASANIRIIPSNINFTTPTTFVCPATACTKTTTGFYARPETGSVIDKGHIKLNSDFFTVFQVDTDGAALKICQQMDALQLKKAKHIFYALENNMPNAFAIPIFNNEMPRKEGLPSHRTAGIAVARNGMAETLNKKFNRMNDLKTKLATGAAAPAGTTGANTVWILPAEVLSADDVNLGYRMDLQPEDKPGQWFSLHRRINKYSFINSGGTAIDIPGIDPDEGFIQISATEEKTDAGPQLKVGEAIARWEGWSLTVPRPGSAMNDPLQDKQEVYDKNISADKTKEEAKYKTPGIADFKLNVMPSVVKGSLPMLRFGKKYSIKIRTVDLAGNSTDVNSIPENNSDCIKGAIRYMRYEPVDAPFLVSGNKVKDGESSEVLVIRSNEGQTPEQYENANKDSKNPVPHKGYTVRHVKPPRATVEMATLHGRLDQAMGTANATKAAEIYNKIKKDKDPFFNPADATYQLQVIDGDAPIKTVEYLADPMAAGVSFFISSADPNPKIPNPYILDRWVSFYFDETFAPAAFNTEISYDKWMAPRTFRIKLMEGPPGIEWKGDNRTLEVSMIKGLIFKMNYACFWRPDDIVKYSGILDMMGMSSLTGPAGDRIQKGQHWMFSPWREITFVHAVQQPISAFGSNKFPLIAAIEPDRNYGDNFASLNSKLSVHGPSTGQLDIEGSWTEWVDDILYEDPAKKDDLQKIPTTAKVFHFTTLYPVFEYIFGDVGPVKKNPFPGIRHLFNDTKHRRVKYKTIATTRYRENFYQLIEDKKEAVLLTREHNYEKEVIIPSSTRPAAPEVAYIIPTFEWNRTTKGSTTTTGRASGLRIYLKRPWYSSGEGEQLAVVLGLQISDNISSGNVPVSTWGTDPTKVSSPLAGGTRLALTSFVNVKDDHVDPMVSAAESETAKVTVAAFDVKYDIERKLYYADIMLNVLATYYPFVRLSLARYQRQSVRKNGTDCCLSAIVQADYIQVPAPRASSLEYKGGKTNIVVAISGTAAAVSNAGSMFRTRVEFIIEPIEVPTSESVHITLNTPPIDSYSYTLKEADIKNFLFYHSHAFSLPAAYASTPYRVKVLEYEMIEYDRLKPNPNPGGQVFGTMPTKDRLVFADVYEAP